MVKIMDIPDTRGRGSFWEAYRACVEENRVRPDRSPFYVSWVKDFANFLPEKALKDMSRKDIEAFLADLGKRRGISAGTVGTCQCRHHHDLHPRTEQARALGKEPGGYLRKVKSNDMVQAPRTIRPRSSWDDRTLSKEDRGVKIFKQILNSDN
jgi:hypothetical protein